MSIVHFGCADSRKGCPMGWVLPILGRGIFHSRTKLLLRILRDVHVRFGCRARTKLLSRFWSADVCSILIAKSSRKRPLLRRPCAVARCTNSLTRNKDRLRVRATFLSETYSLTSLWLPWLVLAKHPFATKLLRHLGADLRTSCGSLAGSTLGRCWIHRPSVLVLDSFWYITIETQRKLQLCVRTPI